MLTLMLMQVLTYNSNQPQRPARDDRWSLAPAGEEKNSASASNQLHGSATGEVVLGFRALLQSKTKHQVDVAHRILIFCHILSTAQ